MKFTSIFKSINTEIRSNSDYKERWGSFDKDFVTSWESGRINRKEVFKHLIPLLQDGALPKLSFTGGHFSSGDDEVKNNYVYRYGTFNYLAQRQGLLGLDLDIDALRDEGLILTCSDTGLKTIFTMDQDKYKENKTFNKKVSYELI